MDKKQFYLLPFEIEGKGFLTPSFLRSGRKKNQPENEEVIKKRDEIFNTELEAVITKVMSSEKQPEKTQDEFQKWISRNLPDNNQLNALEEIYFKANVTPQSLQNFLSAEILQEGISCYTIVLLNENSGCYIPVISNGLDQKTFTNLVFTFESGYLEHNTPITIKSRLDDIFFTKKFSKADLQKLDIMLPLNLADLGIQGYLILFYENGSDEVEMIDDRMYALLRPLAPALKSLRSVFHKRSINCCDSLLIQVYESFKQFIYNERRECNIHKVRILGFMDSSDNQRLKKEIIHALRLILDNTNHIVENTMDGFILFSRTLEAKDLLKIIQNQKIHYDIKSLKFPQYGQNLFSYLD